MTTPIEEDAVLRERVERVLEENEVLRDRVSDLEERVHDQGSPVRVLPEDEEEGSGPWIPPSVSRRGAMAGAAGLIALLLGTGNALGQETVDPDLLGTACEWLGDQQAASYRLWNLGLLHNVNHADATAVESSAGSLAAGQAEGEVRPYWDFGDGMGLVQLATSEDDNLWELVNSGSGVLPVDNRDVGGPGDPVPAIFTESASIGGGDVFKRIERPSLSGSDPSVEFTGLSDLREYRLFFALNHDDNVLIRLNGDGASTGNYFYWDESGTLQSTQNEIQLYDISNSVRIGGSVTITSPSFDSNRAAITHKPLPGGPAPSRIDGFSREGGRNVNEALSSIELLFTGGLVSGSSSMVELWERDWS